MFFLLLFTKLINGCANSFLKNSILPNKPGLRKFICAKYQKVLFCNGVPLVHSLFFASSRRQALVTLKKGSWWPGFHQHYIIKFYLQQYLYITAESAIGGDDDMVVLQLLRTAAAHTVVNMPTTKGWIFHLVFPVIDQCGWTNHNPGCCHCFACNVPAW